MKWCADAGTSTFVVRSDRRADYDGPRRAVTLDLPSWHAASNDIVSSIAGRRLLQPGLIAATTVGNAAPR